MGVCDYHSTYDLSRPVATPETNARPLSEQVRFKVGKGSACIALVNDTDPAFSRDFAFLTGSFHYWNGGYNGLCPRTSSFSLRYPFWEDEPPLVSPFHFPAALLASIIFIIQYFGGGWFGPRTCSLWIVGMLAVLPVCSHVSERCTVTRFLNCHHSGSSQFGHSVRRFTKQFGGVARFVTQGMLLAVLLLIFWTLFPWDPGPGFLRVFLGHSSWRPISSAVGQRIGEAKNPGPQVALSTLNVASLCMHQDEIQAPTSLPTVRVFTETCLTQQILPTIQRKARQCHRFVVPGCICAPRSSAHRFDSQSRGESGGVLICSDVPARKGNVPMDPSAWLSTRVVESIVSMSPHLSIRIVGLYGFSKRYPGHIERTNLLLGHAIRYVTDSTLPCVVVGDFNCDLQELSAWKLLQDKGWVDSAILQHTRDGKEPQPTWKAYSRIDYILLPPSMVPLFSKYVNIPDTFSDHSEVQVVLNVPSEPILRNNWKPCRDMRSFLEQPGWDEVDFQDIDWGPFHELVCQRNVESAYKTFCTNYETMVANARARLALDIPLRQFQGRSAPKIIKKASHAPLVKPSRNGEPSFQVDDAPTVFRQRIRQARRINTLRCQLLRCLQRDTDASRATLEAARNTWQAVYHAPGFPKGFPDFVMKEFGLVIPLTIYPEDLPLIEIMNSSMEEGLSRWKWQYSKTKIHQYLNYMLSDWQKGGRVHFASIRPSPKPEIALLEIPYPMEVMRHRHGKQGPFVITCLDHIPKGVEFAQFADQRRCIVKREPPHLWLDGPISATSAKIKIVLLRPTGSLADIHNMTIKYWAQL